MCKITADIQNAIRTQSKFKGANTEITDGIVRFHGHIIAKQCPISGVWSFCFQGYRTNTTRAKISAAMKGKTRSMESRAKQSATLKGK